MAASRCARTIAPCVTAALLLCPLGVQLASAAEAIRTKELAGQWFAPAFRQPRRAEVLLRQLERSTNAEPPAAFTEEMFLSRSKDRARHNAAGEMDRTAPPLQQLDLPLILPGGLCAVSARKIPAQWLQHRAQSRDVGLCLAADAAPSSLARLRKIAPELLFVPVQRLDLARLLQRRNSDCRPVAGSDSAAPAKAKRRKAARSSSAASQNGPLAPLCGLPVALPE